MNYGIHSEHLTAEVITFCQTYRPRVLVTLDLAPASLEAVRPYVQTIVARYDPNGNTQNTYLGNGTALGQFITAGVSSIRGLFDYVTVLNEPSVSNVTDATNVTHTVVDATTYLHNQGIKVVGGNFSTGTPPLVTDPGGSAILEALIPLFKAVDIIGIHEYSHPSMQTNAPYLCGRWSFLQSYLESQNITTSLGVTEFGIDFATPTDAGYLTHGVTDTSYIADVTWYQPNILWAALFEAGSYNQFTSFDITRSSMVTLYGNLIKEQPLYTTRGIDLSVDQPNVDISVAQASGISFALVNKTQGTDVKLINPYFTPVWNALGSSGMVRGIYHFAWPQYNTAEAEAAFFLANLGQLVPGDLVIIDLEQGTGDLSGWLNIWLTTVQRAIGFKVIIYGSPGTLQGYNVLSNPLFANNPFWLADYNAGWPGPYQNVNLVIWQYTNTATIPGITGLVDENYSMLSSTQLRALGKPIVGTEAESYYFQLGHKVDTSHAIWTYYLLPVYNLWQNLISAKSPIADVINLGPITGAETGTTWGGTQPASIIQTANCTGGVYLGTDGSWDHAYRVEINA